MRSDRGEPGAHDTGEWVDVGANGRWRPTIGQRLRATIILGLLLGGLLTLAAVASVDDGDNERAIDNAEDSAPPDSSETTGPADAPTTTLDPASLAGEPVSADCAADDRRAQAFRPPPETGVLVLNGSPSSGQGALFTDALDEVGYSMSVPANASIRDRTVVEYTTGFCVEAFFVAASLGLGDVAVAALDPESDVFLGRAEILVTLGRDSR